MGRGHVVDLGADLVHRALADAGVHQRLRHRGSVLLVKSDGRLELGKLLADQAVDAPQRVALRDRAPVDQQLAQPVEGAVDLRHSGIVGREIFLLAGEQIAAFAGFRVDDQRQHLVQRRLHFERDRHLPVGEFESPKAELRVDGDGERHDDSQRQRDHYPVGEDRSGQACTWDAPFAGADDNYTQNATRLKGARGAACESLARNLRGLEARRVRRQRAALVFPVFGGMRYARETSALRVAPLLQRPDGGGDRRRDDNALHDGVLHGPVLDGHAVIGV